MIRVILHQISIAFFFFILTSFFLLLTSYFLLLTSYFLLLLPTSYFWHLIIQASSYLFCFFCLTSYCLYILLISTSYVFFFFFFFFLVFCAPCPLSCLLWIWFDLLWKKPFIKQWWMKLFSHKMHQDVISPSLKMPLRHNQDVYTCILWQ